MPRGIKPGQIPDWRPGAVFWKPLDDGREVTVYPLLFGAGRFCVGPLAATDRYDVGYHYKDLDDALKEAERWDGDGEPRGWYSRDSEGVKVRGERQGAQIHSEGVVVNQLLSVSKAMQETALEFTETRNDQGIWINLKVISEDGKVMTIEGLRERTDPVSAMTEVRVTGVKNEPLSAYGGIEIGVDPALPEDTMVAVCPTCKLPVQPWTGCNDDFHKDGPHAMHRES